MSRDTTTTPEQERGATLVVALIMLVLIAIVGIGAMQSTTLQERMAGNLRDQNMAFQASEAGLREREDWLESQTEKPSTSAWLRPRQDLNLNTPFPFGATALEYGTAGSIDLDGVESDPEVVMEELEFVPDSLVKGYDPGKGRDFYRVLSSGSGQTANSESVLETTYAKRFD